MGTAGIAPVWAVTGKIMAKKQDKEKDNLLNKDTLVVTLSDMHSGSSRALFPDKALYLPKAEMKVVPSELQVKLHGHWKMCISAIKEIRKGKRLVIVHNGDATENLHHNITQVMSPSIEDHAEIHLDLMKGLLKDVGFSKKAGDKLYYVEGTESHTLTVENYIAKEVGAEVATTQNGVDYYAFQELSIVENGRELWFTHHGAGAGDGASEGDGYRNWLKRLYWNRVKKGMKVPDMVVSAHVHKPIYQTYVQDWHTLHGMILPSWQVKTRYAYRVAPFQRNDIGLAFFEISAAGDIRVRPPMVMEFTQALRQ
jgi:hypothetical protein